MSLSRLYDSGVQLRMFWGRKLMPLLYIFQTLYSLLTDKVLMWVENNTRCPAFMNPSRPHSLSPTQRLFLSSHPFLRLSIFSCVLSQKLSISIEPSLIISSLCCPFLRRLPQSRTNTLTLPLVFRRMKPGGDMLLTVNRPSLFQQLLIRVVRFSWFDNVK